MWGLLCIDELLAISNLIANTPTTAEFEGAFDPATSGGVEVLFTAHDVMFNGMPVAS